MTDLIASVEGFVVRRAGGPHFPEDFEPALAQTSKGCGMAHALLFFLLVVSLCPGAERSAEVRPEMDRGAESLVARPPHLGDGAFAGLLRDWSGARIGL